MSKPGTKQIGGFVIGVAVLGAALTVIASRASEPAADPSPGKVAPGKLKRSAAEIERDVQKLAQRIDELVEVKAVEAQVVPAPVADDAEFHRRAWLDVAGKIPAAADARDVPGRSRSRQTQEAGRQAARQPKLHRAFYRGLARASAS